MNQLVYIVSQQGEKSQFLKTEVDKLKWIWVTIKIPNTFGLPTNIYTPDGIINKDYEIYIYIFLLPESVPW